MNSEEFETPNLKINLAIHNRSKRLAFLKEAVSPPGSTNHFLFFFFKLQIQCWLPSQDSSKLYKGDRVREHLSTGESMVLTGGIHGILLQCQNTNQRSIFNFFFLHLPLIRNEWKPLELDLGKLKNAALILM